MTRGAASLTAPGRRMGEVETIFALLGVVYMAECCLATDKNALIFSPAPFAQRLRKGITITLRSALVFLNPIPPFTTANVCHLAPVSLSPKGVVLYNSLTHDLARLRPPGHNFIAYGDIARLEYDKEGRLHINDLEFPCGGEEQARQLASDIGRLSILSKSTLYAGAALDKAMEDELRAMFSPRLDAAAIIARRREVRWRSLPAICAATLLCVQLFAVAPTVMILSSAHKIWLIAALVLLGLHCLTVLCFWLGHRRLYPAAGEERLKRLLTMLCNPFAAMSCPAWLTRNGLAAFHPMLVGFALLRGRARREFMHRAWARLKYNTFPNYGDALAHDELSAHNNLLRAEAARHLASLGVEAEKLQLRPPLDPTAQAHCPICLIQYTVNHGQCLYCLGVPLHKSNLPQGK